MRYAEKYIFLICVLNRVKNPKTLPMFGFVNYLVHLLSRHVKIQQDEYYFYEIGLVFNNEWVVDGVRFQRFTGSKINPLVRSSTSKMLCRSGKHLWFITLLMWD